MDKSNETAGGNKGQDQVKNQGQSKGQEQGQGRYPGGCQIEGHQGYGCNCTQVTTQARKG